MNRNSIDKYYELKREGVIDSRMDMVLLEFKKFPSKSFTARELTAKFFPEIDNYFEFEHKVRYIRPALSDLKKIKLIEDNGRKEELLLSGKKETVIKYKLINYADEQIGMFN